MGRPVKLVTQTALGNQIELTVKRWFQTREFLVSAGTTTLVVIPYLLDSIGTIGLSPRMLLASTVALMVARELIGNWLKATSRTIVMGKDEYRQAKEESRVTQDQPPPAMGG